MRQKIATCNAGVVTENLIRPVLGIIVFGHRSKRRPTFRFADGPTKKRANGALCGVWTDRPRKCN